LFGLLFDHEDGCSKFLHNIGELLPDNTSKMVLFKQEFDLDVAYQFGQN
jgi:hypothetical protein